MTFSYETGAMRRVHLRGSDDVLKRVLAHAAAFNIGLLLRKLSGWGKPRTNSRCRQSYLQPRNLRLGLVAITSTMVEELRRLRLQNLSDRSSLKAFLEAA